MEVEKIGLQRLIILRQYSVVLYESWQCYSDFHDRKPDDMPLVWFKLWLTKRHPELLELAE